MVEKDTIGTLFNGFSKLNRRERLERLVKMGALTKDDIKHLNNGQINPHLAEHFIENVIGYFHMPLGVAAYLRIDDNDYAIPMAVEETSIIASLSKTAKWIRQSGKITTELLGSGYSIGQIQFPVVKKFSKFKLIIEKHKEELINSVNQDVAYGLVKRGGGVKDLEIRKIDRDAHQHMAVVHILADTCDAMGANIITQICEYLKVPLEQLTKEKASMCILSNLNDQKLVKATVTLFNIEEELGNKIAEASLFAQLDPYRAATNNKGVLNGIDPILIATGNDWRAVEAGVHAYACKNGQYQSITNWRMDKNTLIGEFIAPITLGIVGGMTSLHPTAQLCLKMMNIQSANQLARIIGAVGLVQNLGALKALTTVGLVQGHMKLHISNLSLNAGAKEEEMPALQKRLEELLNLRKRITLTNAIEILKEIRLRNLPSVTGQEQTA